MNSKKDFKAAGFHMPLKQLVGLTMLKHRYTGIEENNQFQADCVLDISEICVRPPFRPFLVGFFY